MSRASTARRIAAGAAYGGAGLSAAGTIGAALLVGLLRGQTKLARRRIPRAESEPPSAHGTVWAAEGVSLGRPPIRLAMVGDSTAAGYGVHRPEDTPGVRLAIGVSEVARRPVQLSNVAQVGAQSGQLVGQVAQLPSGIELAIVLIGANDVTHRVKPIDSVRFLGEAVAALRALGAEVIVGTCPDLGTLRPLSQPLRAYARRISRRLAAAQTIAVIDSGGRTVSLGDLLGPLFDKHLHFFAEDRFHPSAEGYALVAHTLLPSALDALGLHTKAKAATPLSTRRARPVARAAAKAAGHPGTEVAPTEVRGQAEGRRGAWVRLRRRRTAGPVAASPETAQELVAADG